MTGMHLCLEECVRRGVVSGQGSTALMWASENGHLEIAVLLLDRGASIEHADTDGRLTRAHIPTQTHCHTRSRVIHPHAWVVSGCGPSVRRGCDVRAITWLGNSFVCSYGCVSEKS